MRRLWIMLLSVALALAALACTTSAGTTQGHGAVEVTNNSSITICYLYLSPSEIAEWGEDQLGEENSIPPGASFTIFEIPAGTYDLRAEDCSHAEIGVEEGIRVGSGQTVTWAFDGG